MALKSSKISSEIIQTCNKLFSSSAEAGLKSALTSSTTCNDRYTIGNMAKPKNLPTIHFEKGQFSDLQPSNQPRIYRSDQMPRWEPPDNTSIVSSPFPRPFVTNDVGTIYNDRQRAEDRVLEQKVLFFSPTTRKMSSLSVRHYTRPAQNSSSGHCKQNLGNKCASKIKQKKICHSKEGDCPKHRLKNCKQGKPRTCQLAYLDPQCEKQFAPYPSYSESCVEIQPEDPSECQQCPWRTCDGADTIEPGKPVRSKRHYSTVALKHLQVTSGIITQPPSLPFELGYCLAPDKCGQIKSPCQRPPGHCESLKKKKQKNEKNKQESGTDKSKKALQEGPEIMLTNGRAMLMNPYTLSPIPLNDLPLKNGESWLDIDIEREGMLLDKQKKPKWPNCPNKKAPKRPPENIKSGKTVIIEVGNADWWTGRGKKPIETSKDPNIPGNKCKPVKIKTKKSLLLADKSKDKSKKGQKGKRIRGDEGHPPPCPETESASRNCPETSVEKPKYRRRPMNTGYYKNPEDPYSKSS